MHIGYIHKIFTNQDTTNKVILLVTNKGAEEYEIFFLKEFVFFQFQFQGYFKVIPCL